MGCNQSRNTEYNDSDSESASSHRLPPFDNIQPYRTQSVASSKRSSAKRASGLNLNNDSNITRLHSISVTKNGTVSSNHANTNSNHSHQNSVKSNSSHHSQHSLHSDKQNAPNSSKQNLHNPLKYRTKITVYKPQLKAPSPQQPQQSNNLRPKSNDYSRRQKSRDDFALHLGVNTNYNRFNRRGFGGVRGNFASRNNYRTGQNMDIFPYHLGVGNAYDAGGVTDLESDTEMVDANERNAHRRQATYHAYGGEDEEEEDGDDETRISNSESGIDVEYTIHEEDEYGEEEEETSEHDDTSTEYIEADEQDYDQLQVEELAATAMRRHTIGHAVDTEVPVIQSSSLAANKYPYDTNTDTESEADGMTTDEDVAGNAVAMAAMAGSPMAKSVDIEDIDHTEFLQKVMKNATNKATASSMLKEKEDKLKETHRTSNIKVIDDNTIAINIRMSKVVTDTHHAQNEADEHYENQSEDEEEDEQKTENVNMANMDGNEVKTFRVNVEGIGVYQDSKLTDEVFSVQLQKGEVIQGQYINAKIVMVTKWKMYVAATAVLEVEATETHTKDNFSSTQTTLQSDTETNSPSMSPSKPVSSIKKTEAVNQKSAAIAIAKQEPKKERREEQKSPSKSVSASENIVEPQPKPKPIVIQSKSIKERQKMFNQPKSVTPTPKTQNKLQTKPQPKPQATTPSAIAAKTSPFPETAPTKSTPKKVNALAARFGNMNINPSALKPGAVPARFSRPRSRTTGSMPPTTQHQDAKTQQVTIAQGRRRKRSKRRKITATSPEFMSDNAPKLFSNEATVASSAAVPSFEQPRAQKSEPKTKAKTKSISKPKWKENAVSPPIIKAKSIQERSMMFGNKKPTQSMTPTPKKTERNNVETKPKPKPKTGIKLFSKSKPKTNSKPQPKSSPKTKPKVSPKSSPKMKPKQALPARQSLPPQNYRPSAKKEATKSNKNSPKKSSISPALKTNTGEVIKPRVSLKDRMAMLQETSSGIGATAQERLDKIKEARRTSDGKVSLPEEQKKRASLLLQEYASGQAKQIADVTLIDKTMKDVTKQNCLEKLETLGILTYIYVPINAFERWNNRNSIQNAMDDGKDNEDKFKKNEAKYVRMGNITLLNSKILIKLQEEQKELFKTLILFGLEKCQFLYKLNFNASNITNVFLEKILSVLAQRNERISKQEQVHNVDKADKTAIYGPEMLLIENNPISDRGIDMVCNYVQQNGAHLKCLKTGHCFATIASQICATFCDSLEQNQFILKVTFDMRWNEHRQSVDKSLKRNYAKYRQEQKAYKISLNSK